MVLRNSIRHTFFILACCFCLLSVASASMTTVSQLTARPLLSENLQITVKTASAVKKKYRLLLKEIIACKLLMHIDNTFFCEKVAIAFKFHQTETQNQTDITTYQYDNADRLTQFEVKQADNTQEITTYSLDAVSNRLTEKVTRNSLVNTDKTYHYNSLNQVTKITDNLFQANIDYTYDKNGNTTQKTDNATPTPIITQFEYDSRDQLTQVIRGPPGNPEILGQFDYNHAGQRTQHLKSSRGDVEYFYDGQSVIHEQNITTQTPLAHYTFGAQLLSLTAPDGIQYYHFDGLNSTVNLSDENGSNKVSYSLDPWGHIKNQTGESVNRQIFTGQEHDEKTGLIYFGARFYDPDTARFINQDSYLGKTITPPSLHRYLYAYANPTVYIDLMGYLSQKDLENRGTNLLYEGDYLGWGANVLAGSAYMAGNWLTGDSFEQHDAKMKQGITPGEAASSVAGDKVNESIQTIKDEGLIKGSAMIGCAVVKQCKVAVKAAKKAGEKIGNFLDSDVKTVLRSQKKGKNDSQIKMTQEPGPSSTVPPNRDTRPYNSNRARADLEAVFGVDNVRSSTNPNSPYQRVNSNPEKNIEVIHGSNESKVVRVGYEDPATGEQFTANIPYNERGLPIFDDVVKYTTNIDKTKTHSSQMRQATRDIRDGIRNGKVNARQFTETQLEDIMSGSAQIDGFTWHHNAVSNNMQLIPFDIHDAVKHIGEAALSKGK